MSAYIYIEGGARGADSKYQKFKCQEAFHKLLTRMGFERRKPRLVACGGRDFVYERFCTEHSAGRAAYVAMWIDSEEPTVDLEATWQHLQRIRTVNQWARPKGAEDDQVLFMTTCMETWIVADRQALTNNYGTKLHESALPSLSNIESRDRHDVQERLQHATRDCSRPYKKGVESYELFGALTPSTISAHLPSLARIKRILETKL